MSYLFNKYNNYEEILTDIFFVRYDVCVFSWPGQNGFHFEMRTGLKLSAESRGESSIV